MEPLLHIPGKRPGFRSLRSRWTQSFQSRKPPATEHQGMCAKNQFSTDFQTDDERSDAGIGWMPPPEAHAVRIAELIVVVDELKNRHGYTHTQLRHSTTTTSPLAKARTNRSKSCFSRSEINMWHALVASSPL